MNYPATVAALIPSGIVSAFLLRLVLPFARIALGALLVQVTRKWHPRARDLAHDAVRQWLLPRPRTTPPDDRGDSSPAQ